jgi:hypothetical protein
MFVTFENNTPQGFMPMLFGHTMVLCESAELSDGTEAVFYGGDNGMVYQSDKGTSFDGGAIDAYMTFVFNHSKSPRTLKQYRKAVLEIGGNGYSRFYLSADLAYGSTEIEQIPNREVSMEGINLEAGNWDDGNWDTGVWDGKTLLPAEHELTGVGQNISLRLSQSSDYYEPITFYGVLLHYTPRRNLR